ncbi:MAG TPA: VWA domain-containing protein [Thermoanaerobaculia bacterium]|nr:VWA domain-containing protein [Thermoanaerobaculia bacterium]
MDVHRGPYAPVAAWDVRPGSGRRAGRRLLLAALSGLLAAGASPRAQQPTVQPISDTVFSESLAVLEVEVPVQVLRDGLPVRGLRRADFEVLDRGVARPIVGFEAVDLQTVAPGAGEPAPASRPESQRSLLVLIDYSFNATGWVGRSIAATRELVDRQLHPADRVAVVALGARGRVSILTGFTADRRRLGLALDLARALADRRRAAARELALQLDAEGPRSAEARAEAYGAAASQAFGAGIDQLVAVNDLSIATVPAGADAGMAGEVDAQLGARGGGSGIEEAFAIGGRLSAFGRFQESAGFAEALGNLGSLLRGVAGHKQALLFSQGPPAATLLQGAGPDAPEGAAMVARAMEGMIEQLGRAGWPVYTFGQGAGFSDTLFYLSEETGGTAFENAGRLADATAQLVAQTSVTYVLRFVATDLPRDGRRHALAVRLSGELATERGLVIRHRPHYFAPRADAELGDVERRIQAAERQLESELRALDARVLALRIPGADADRLLLVVQVSTRQIEELAAGGSAVTLEVIAAAERESPADVLRQRVDLDLARIGELPPGGLAVIGDLVLDAADRAIRVTAASGARAASSVHRLTARPPGEPVALPPLLLTAAGRRLVIRAARDGVPVSTPLRSGDRDLVPQLDPAVERGDVLGVALLLLADPGGPGPPEEALPGLRLLDGDGRPLDAGGALALQEEGVDGEVARFLFALDTGALEPGSYAVEGLWPEDLGITETSRFRVVEGG